MTTKDIIENCKKIRGIHTITHISAASCPFSVVLYVNIVYIVYNFILHIL